jgi:hypothetical protein
MLDDSGFHHSALADFRDRLAQGDRADRLIDLALAGAAPQLLAGLVDEEWGRRYGRPVQLGKNPTRPKTRIANAGDDALQLLEHLHTHRTGHAFGLRVQTLRQIVVQNYYRDTAGRGQRHCSNRPTSEHEHCSTDTSRHSNAPTQACWNRCYAPTPHWKRHHSATGRQAGRCASTCSTRTCWARQATGG